MTTSIVSYKTVFKARRSYINKQDQLEQVSRLLLETASPNRKIEGGKLGSK